MKLGTGVRSIYSAFISIALVLGMQACGGGGTPSNANPTGYYTGSATVKADDNITDLVLDIHIFSNNGRIMIMSNSQDFFNAQSVLYDGTMSIIGNNFTATVDVYKNGVKQTGAAGTSNISGSITAGSQITGTLSGTGLGNGTFESLYSNLNNTASSAAIIDTAGESWNCIINEYNISILSLGVNSTGTVNTNLPNTTTIFSFCEVAGSVTAISGTGLYSVNMSTLANSCSTSEVNSQNTGDYTGLAITTTNTNPNDRLLFSMSNESYNVVASCNLTN